ncbi:hypothetical protein LGN13_25690 [Burkholderia multivorans]|uniref:hypothetical protein n=1 Tax=Burkholderia cepacia complex TaxID=87882 RepID=UPI0009E0DCC6|nr:MULTISPECIES: hypothetical protein [Burkholderia cepacia complex]MCA7923054.1 hypothetical protein [Burkholderia cenocepacia]MCA8505089.1 hypothetical protein [Burkholderia multivorans]MDN8083722.1 hypothetical protein [Burkholderia multivorans]SAK29191.1 hypothetical protein UA12_02186 [Burkholderia multivorans]SAK33583.1 hypothetical protein UA11_02253 [Burkholderia multivorans]
MFDDKDALEQQVKFAVGAAYEKFAKQWDMVLDKLEWVKVWTPFLSKFTVSEINTASDYWAKEFQRPPVPVELIELARRVRSGSPLSAPIVSKIERMAYLILHSDEFSGVDVTLSEVSDACLIAAAIAQRKAYDDLNMNMPNDYLLDELSGRARMFSEEAALWRHAATDGKGYWADTFRPKDGS